MIHLDVAPDPPTAAARAAAWLTDRAVDAIARRGAFHLAVSGGSSPLPMFGAFASGAGGTGGTAAAEVDWHAVHVYQVDERVAPDGSEDRNATGLRRALLERVPIPPAQVHLMDVGAADLDDAATRYGILLDGLVFDVVHLGVGEDGHTASWPPGDPVVDRPGDVAMVGPFNGLRRMTLLPAAVNRAAARLWLVTGATKRDALAKLLAGDATIPAGLVTPASSVVFADVGAAGAGRPSP